MGQEGYIYKTAELLIEIHGNYALLEVMHRIEHSWISADVLSAEEWQKVANLIEWMQISSEGQCIN